ncbi:MAG: hypothetical protein ACR2N5_02785 [Solirubrobacterales bacterium]
MAAERTRLSKREILEREERWARPVALTAIAVAVLFIVAAILSAGAISDADDSSAFLEEFEATRQTQLIVSILQAIGLALLAIPLLFLFQAAAARSDRMRNAFVGITVAGPLFLAAAFIARWVAFDGASMDFVMGAGDPEVTPDDRADDLIEAQSAFSVTQGLQFAGSLGVVFGVGYTSLYSMRVGLLSRFFGTLGIVLGVSVLFLGTALGIVLFVVLVGMMIGGFWPRARPPAWDAGEAMPWPKGGGAPSREPPPAEEEPGLPEGFGEPLEPDGDEHAELEPGEDSAEGPRKRKRRR